ncbi:MAG: S-adenosylmethionine synthetase [Candidatus Saccharibacteria bacterium]|nr:S-adenosylmethionine synthetase [Candidatus Saccharibacteria bacterium]
MSIQVNHEFLSPDHGAQEVVERKGLGHPDTLVDGIVEATEIAYAKYCRENFGAIPHHNLDKATLVGGLCVQQFGGGDFEQPLKMIFLGRASRTFGSKEIPLDDIQNSVTKQYLSRILPHLDTQDPTVYQWESQTSTRSTRPYWFSPRTIDDLPEYSGKSPRANDTATMISYWPLTTTEKLALDIEGFFYGDDENGLPHPRFELIGQDIKVMCVRNGDQLSATVCVPQITTHTSSESAYYEREDDITRELEGYVASLSANESLEINLTVNSQTKGPNPHPYLVTGGSCTDFGEEGAVGRGNKTHGIISSFRPNTMEAPHGKNPTYFVGKVLGYQADIISKAIYESTGSRCQIVLQANMGDDLFDPSNIIVSTEDDVPSKDVDSIVAKCLGIGRQTTDLIIDSGHFIPRTNAWSPSDQS